MPERVCKISYIIVLGSYTCLYTELALLTAEEQRQMWVDFYQSKKGMKIGDTINVNDNITLYREKKMTYIYTLR